MPRVLLPQIFSATNLNVEREKESHHFPFHWILHAEIRVADVVRSLTFCWPLSDVSGSLSWGSLVRKQVPASILPTVREGEISPPTLLSSFGWSNN